MLQQMGIVAIFSLLVGLLPAGMGFLYAVRPSEARLALMRPVSLAGLFGGLAGCVVGLVNALQYIAARNIPMSSPSVLVGISESLVTLFVAFGSLTVAWLLVAFGMRRQSA